MGAFFAVGFFTKGFLRTDFVEVDLTSLGRGDIGLATNFAEFPEAWGVSGFCGSAFAAVAFCGSAVFVERGSSFRLEEERRDDVSWIEVFLVVRTAPRDF